MLELDDLDGLRGLAKRIADAGKADATIVRDILRTACRRYPSIGQTAKTARFDQLIGLGAWTEAALALIEIELPLWQVRRIAYDEGEWHCALSRERELPDWLDRSIEARHADLAMAILSAFVEAQRVSAPESRTSVPEVRRDLYDLAETLASDNFA